MGTKQPVNILSLETSSLYGSIAVQRDDELIEYIKLTTDRRTAQSLAPAVADLLKHVGWEPTDVDLIAVTTGPGSFTGLRVGVTMAKTFAYAAGAKVVGVNTLDAIARQVPGDFEKLTCAIDAHRGQVFRKSFVRTADGVDASNTEVVEADDFIRALDETTIVAGPVIVKFADRLDSKVKLADRDNWEPTATSVGELGFERFQQDGADDVWGLVPQYFRKSAAEEKAAQT